MNKQELIEKYELELKDVQLKFGASFKTKVYEELLEDLKQLDEPQPIKLKNVTARIKQLDIGTRKVWLDEFLNELGSDYGTLKYKAGYEQGKFDGAVEREKVQVPQFVADWIDNMKCQGKTLYYGLDHTPPEEVNLWFCEDEANHQNNFARAWLDGYTVEKEKRYLVKMKSIDTNFNFLNRHRNENYWIFSRKDKNTLYQTQHTRKELEEAGLGWVFDSPGIEVEEVEE